MAHTTSQPGIQSHSVDPEHNIFSRYLVWGVSRGKDGKGAPMSVWENSYANLHEATMSAIMLQFTYSETFIEDQHGPQIGVASNIVARYSSE